MKCLSLWQPWASLWLSPAKIYETRGWATSHQGPLLVHAAKKVMQRHQIDPALAAVCDSVLGVGWDADMPRGAIVGKVLLIGCAPTERLRGQKLVARDTVEWQCGDFGFGRFGWQRASEITRFKEPIEYRGRQQLFEVPDELLRDKIVEVIHV